MYNELYIILWFKSSTQVSRPKTVESGIKINKKDALNRFCQF